MGGIDAKKPKPGMKIRGKFGIYKLTKEIGGGGNGTVFSVEVISAEKQLPEKEKKEKNVLKEKSGMYIKSSTRLKVLSQFMILPIFWKSGKALHGI